MENIERAAVKDKTNPDDLLILSCEEDYSICELFLEEGIKFFSILCFVVPQKFKFIILWHQCEIDLYFCRRSSLQFRASTKWHSYPETRLPEVHITTKA